MIDLYFRYISPYAPYSKIRRVPWWRADRPVCVYRNFEVWMYSQASGMELRDATMLEF